MGRDPRTEKLVRGPLSMGRITMLIAIFGPRIVFEPESQTLIGRLLLANQNTERI